MSNAEQQGHIFLSYRNIEADFALKLAADLKNAGVRLWMDRLDGITVGMDWRDAIQQAINDCAAMIAVLSPDYIESEYCRKEMARANTLKRPIFPVLLRPVDPKEWPFVIEGVQYEDFTDWHDERVYHERLTKLLRRLGTEAAEQIKEAPDAETRYLTSLIAELESRRGVLEYVELAAEADAPPDIRPKPLVDDEWGFAELVGGRQGELQQGEAQKIPLKSIAEAVEKHARFVLIGEPGAGKTTTIRRLALEAARKHLENPRTAPLPFLLALPQWGNESTPLDFVWAKWPLGGNLAGLLKHGDVLLYLDGLNEMGAEGPRKAKLLSSWIESADAPARLIVTCRAGDYAGDLRLGNMPTVLAQELEPPQVRQFVTNYLHERSNGLLTRIFPTDEDLQRQEYWPETVRQWIEARSLLRLARNPYMLSALIITFENSQEGELPSNMGALFKNLVRALWRREERRGTTGEIKFGEVEAAFARLAFAIIDEDKSVDVPMEFALNKIGDTKLLQAGVRASYVLIDSDHIRFYHQLMLEYFAAVKLDNTDISPVLGEISKVRDSPLGMYGELVSSKWDQVVISLCGLTAITDSHLRKIVAADTYLAAKWVTSGVGFSPSTYNEVLSLILQEADRSPMFAARTVFSVLADAKEFRVITPLIKLLAHFNFHRVGSKATDALIRFGTEAVPTLIEALSDPNSEVRVRVAAILAAIRDESAVPALIERLFDKEGSGWGKPTYTCDVAAKALKLIGTPEALDAVEKWQVNLINELINLERNTYSNRWSIQEMFEWSPDSFRESLSKVFDNNKVLDLSNRLSEASVEALGVIGNPIAIPALEHALQMPSYLNDPRMVSVILRALERIGTPEARAVIENWELGAKG
jgi:HEAT repeat protein